MSGYFSKEEEIKNRGFLPQEPLETPEHPKVVYCNTHVMLESQFSQLDQMVLLVLIVAVEESMNWTKLPNYWMIDSSCSNHYYYCSE